MIERSLELVRRRGATGDALFRDASTLSLKFEAGRLKESAFSQEAGLNLRVFTGGRYGVAGTTDVGAVEDVVSRAMASAAEGEELDVELPGAAALPDVSTWDDAASALDVETLARMGRAVVERLARPGWQVSASVERQVDRTTFANTSGQTYSYRSTAVSVSAEVTRVSGDDVLMAYDYAALVGPPSDADLEGIARRVILKMERAERVVESPEGRLPVLFTPEGTSAVFLPIRQALSGKSVVQGISPLGGRIGERMFDAALTMTDEPLLPGRIGSRPADDEGTVSVRLPLVEGGVLRAFVYDLETASRAGVSSTGHGQRSVFGKPRIGFSNFVIAGGELDEAALLADMGHGLVVEELIGVGQGNVVGGAFSHPVALAYRVDGGEITGRVKDAAVAGNAYELLKRVRALGREGKWIGGTRYVPPVVLDGVSVARR